MVGTPVLFYCYLKPPLCKGRWHGAAVTEGLSRLPGESVYIRKVTIPQAASRPAPFTQGSL